MSDSWFDRYARITPFVIVAAVVLGYVIAGGIWWGIPVVAAVGLIYAAFRIGLARRIVTSVNRRISRH